MTRLDPNDWMLQYAARRKAVVNAETAVEEHVRRQLRGEPTEHETTWTAAKAAVVQTIANQGDR